MGCAISQNSRFSCRKPEDGNGAPYVPHFEAPRKSFKFVNYERSDIQCGSGRAEVTADSVVIFSHINSEEIPLDCIRKYGLMNNNCFMFETGRRCPSGEATHIIWIEKANDILVELDQTYAWRRQAWDLREKQMLLEKENAKLSGLDDPINSTLLQRRAAMNAYVTEPVADRRRRMRKRRERDPIVTSSDTDSRSDLERRPTQSATTTASGPTAPLSSRHSSPKSSSPQTDRSSDTPPRHNKAPSPAKLSSSSHRGRLHGESSSECMSAKHRSHRPPRARSRHSNTYKPSTGMPTHFESQLVDNYSQSTDTLDFSDVGDTGDCGSTENSRSSSTSTNDLDSMSMRSQASMQFDVKSNVISTSPTSTRTVVPSVSSIATLRDELIEDSDSDKTLCAASPSSAEEKFSSPMTSSAASVSSDGAESSTGEVEQHRCVLEVADDSDEDCRTATQLDSVGDDTHTPPSTDTETQTRHGCKPSSSSPAVNLALMPDVQSMQLEMEEDTDSPPMTGRVELLPKCCHRRTFSLDSGNASLDRAQVQVNSRCQCLRSDEQVTSFTTAVCDEPTEPL